MAVTQTVLETMEGEMLKWRGHVLRMADDRWPKRRWNCPPEENEEEGPK